MWMIPRYRCTRGPNFHSYKTAVLQVFLLPCLSLQLIANWHVLHCAELYYDRGNHQEFTSLVRELARPGEVTQNASYDFEFIQVEKPYESYTGTNVKLRYIAVGSVSCFTVGCI